MKRANLQKDGRAGKNSVRQTKTPRNRALEVEQFLDDRARAIAKLSQATRRQRYIDVGLIVAEGLAMAKDEQGWLEFTRLPFWTKVKGARPKPSQRDRAFRFLLRRYCGPSRKNSKKASEMALAAETLLEEGHEPSTFAKHLERRGGFKGINADRRKGKVNKTSGTTPPVFAVRGASVVLSSIPQDLVLPRPGCLVMAAVKKVLPNGKVQLDWVVCDHYDE